jgi:hypothetical protein
MNTASPNDGVAYVFGDPYNSNSTWSATANYDYTVYNQALNDSAILV